MLGTKKDIINSLQRQLNTMSGVQLGGEGLTRANPLPFMRMHFPQDCFPTTCIHELLCQTPECFAASGAFAAGVLSACVPEQGIVVWISRRQQIFPPALVQYKVLPHRVVFVQVANEKEARWSTEEALKCEGLAAVVAEVEEFGYKQSRRLQLAIEKSKATGFIFNTSKLPENNTSTARWKIVPVSAAKTNLPGMGHPLWKVELLKMRNGKTGYWLVEWNGECFVERHSEVAVFSEVYHVQAG